MSKNLVVDRGLLKRAGTEDGPSFEQQFGILSNAQITDKYPSLGAYQVAFQLIDKNDENTEATGASVYVLGKNTIYVPAFFRGGKISTAEIMFIPALLMFLPLSDAWMSWVKNKDVTEVGELIPTELKQDQAVTPGSAQAKDNTNPFMKNASLKEVSVLDCALKLGKRASLAMLDVLSNNDYLNSAFHFYTPQQMADFAKKASLLLDVAPAKPLIITVMDKKAALLSRKEKAKLYMDGYIIKTAAEPDTGKPKLKTIRSSNVDRQFGSIPKSCVCEILMQDGSTVKATVIKAPKAETDPYRPFLGLRHRTGTLNPSAKKSMGCSQGIKTVALIDGKMHDVDPYAVCLLASVLDLPKDLGKSLDSLDRIPWDSIVICPEGYTMALSNSYDRAANKDNEFFSFSATLSESSEDDLIKPIINEHSIVLPKGSKIIFDTRENNLNGTHKDFKLIPNLNAPKFVALNDLGKTITRFINKSYNRVKVSSDGQLISISGPKSDTANRMQAKNAALHLVETYGMDPDDAKILLKLTMLAGLTKPASNTYYIEKRAEFLDWPNSDIAMTLTPQGLPQTDYKTMPLTPEKLAQEVQTASDAGIKEVFDMRTLKLLLEVADPQQEVLLIIPDLMTCLDKLCRLLYLYRSHLKDMLERYGAVKMKALEQSLQNTLKDMSELTIFLKLRGLSNDTNNNADAGDLQTGKMM